MEPLERKVADFVQGNDLFAGAGRILLAVSGGADSIALLHVMRRLTQRRAIAAELLCAHLNHGLRGADADGDEAFVVRQAHELGVPVVTRTIDVKAHAREQRLSIETAARQQRLNALAEIARECNCPSIGMGHQKNDNAETVLQRLERGTGLRGLGGIRPSRRGGDGLTFVRPLLCCSRSEIVAYLHSRDLTWREDRTNADCVHTRNRIRRHLLPALQAEGSGSLVDELAALSVSAGRLYDRIAREAAVATEQYANCDGTTAGIDATALAGLAEPVAVELLRQLLTALGLGERDLTRRHYGDLLALAGRRPAKRRLSLPDGFYAQRESSEIVLGRPTPQGRDLPGPVELCMPGATQFGPYLVNAQVLDATLVDRAAIAARSDPFLEYLDFDRVRLPLVVRARRVGDRFVPLGQQRVRRLGKFLTAARVPGDVRSQTFLIEDAERILWVCPVRIGEHAKITDKTRRILQLTVTPT